MVGSPPSKMVQAYRPKPKRQLSTLTTLGFVGVVLLVVALFWKGHSSVLRIHTSLHSPILEQAAGWAALHRTTTVQSATVSISGSSITGSALTATTTELQATGQGAAGQQAAAQAAATIAAAAAAANSSQRTGNSLAGMLGDLQHSLYTMLALHTAGGKVSRAELATAAAASMPDEGRDIELHPHKVAQVVDKAKVLQQLQRLARGELSADAGEVGERTSAEQTAELYGSSVGTVVFTIAAGAPATCPAASASPAAAQAAVVLVAGNSTAAFKRSLGELVVMYSRASPDVQSAYHLYAVVDDSSNKDLARVATSYVRDTLAAVRLVKYVTHDDIDKQAMGQSSYSRKQQQHPVADAKLQLPGQQQSIVLGAKKLTSPLSNSTSSQNAYSKAAVATADVNPASCGSSTYRALHTFLRCFKYPAVILLEDDVQFAPDLLNFFYSTQWLLSSDSSLYCLSAWNPQGRQQRAVQPFRLIRTDTHPSRSWYVTAQLGEELLQKWPSGNGASSSAAAGTAGCTAGCPGCDQSMWDMLSREDIRQGRQCLVPEMPRVTPVTTAGEESSNDGDLTPVSDGQHFHQQTMLKAADYAIYSGDSKAGDSSFVQNGDVDVEAFLEASLEDSHEDSAASGDLPMLHLQHELASDVGAGSIRDRQQHPSGSDTVGSQNHSGWLHEDLSMLLENEYEDQMHQILRSARLCDVSAAVLLKDTHMACVVTYNSAAYLSAAAHRLGMPVKVQQGVRYCYPLPAAAEAATGPRQQCQDYLPEIAYRGIISGYNHHNVRMFLVHTNYMQALKQVSAMIEAR